MITFLVADITVHPGWGIGDATDDDSALDRDLLTDVHGRPWIPGSGLAGSLRAHLRRHDADLAAELMGSPPPTHGDHELTASDLWILGTRFTPDPEEPLTEIVGQTGIDRARGAATAGSLRHTRTVTAGGTLTAYLRYDGDLSAPVLALVAAWQPTIGRDRTAGNGRTTLTRLRHGTIDPATPDGLRIWLRHTGPDLIDTVAVHGLPPNPEPTPPSVIDVTVSVVGALLIGDPRLTGPAATRSRAGTPLIPASTWKGLFRSRTEYILRSIGIPACTTPVGCGTCPTCHLYGHPEGRGLLRFNDTPITDAQIPAPRTHNGLDRVTGGTRAGILYQTQPVTAGTVRLRIDALTDALPGWTTNLLTHVLRDLHDGVIGIGSRTTRGYGTVTVTPPPNPQPLKPHAIEDHAR
ncbi:RAMP superfamily CRISPR-associated protein [Mangrovihabitans endophyticus]|uniref:CRISPR type III-associated protein domain-containing protein n=1 Tax=Mangrovihabitans endophyticus TaxID=1751298 RepID=A0A8J3C8V9_9ACTN|nr:RAMP superfamily CRISPR-associated protein [Mangrovihabitans endophyticus]GGL19448.1 hypothetical protein GCM10012284_62460 [Mangrovihabitans endophyticus]